MNNSNSLSTHEICQMFNISKSTLFRWQENTDFPYIGRVNNNQRSYNVEHLKYIAHKQLAKFQKRYEQWHQSFERIDELAEKETSIRLDYNNLTAEIALSKFLTGNEIGLDELELYSRKPISESLILRMDTIVSNLYKPGEKNYTRLHKIIAVHSKELQTLEDA